MRAVLHSGQAVIVTDQDVRWVPLLDIVSTRPWSPSIGRAWRLVVLEVGDVDEDWQVGRLVWVDVPSSVSLADLETRRGPKKNGVAVLAKQEAVVAERAFLWKVVGNMGGLRSSA